MKLNKDVTPKWARYKTTDRDGTIWYHELYPRITDYDGWASDGESIGFSPENENWEDSLTPVNRPSIGGDRNYSQATTADELFEEFLLGEGDYTKACSLLAGEKEIVCYGSNDFGYPCTVLAFQDEEYDDYWLGVFQNMSKALKIAKELRTIQKKWRSK